MCVSAPKMPQLPPTPPPPPIQMNDRVRPSPARKKSRTAAVDGTSALAIPMTPTDVGPGMPS